MSRTIGPASCSVQTAMIECYVTEAGMVDAKGDEEGSIEGYGDDAAEDASWGDYPIDTLLIRTEPRTVHDVLRRIRAGSYVMDPDFQRDFVWDENKQSKLIESVLMRIPLPVFYIAESADGKMIVVDGLQRLTTFRRFCDNEFGLRLPRRSELNKKKFSSLSPKLQNRIEDCNLILYIIDSKVKQQALLDIFERVNSGQPLTRQQMRNCLFTGPATRFLKALATEELFIEATGGSLRSDRMADREMINRHCAFRLLGISNYAGSMDDFLAEALRKMNESDSEDRLNKLGSDLRLSLKNNLTVFNQHAFRKMPPDQGRRSVFNASIWDVMSFHLADVGEVAVGENKERIRSGFLQLLGDDRFVASVTLGTNQVDRVAARFKFVREMFEGLFGPHPNWR